MEPTEDEIEAIVSGEQEIVMEKRLGRTRLPDGAIDLSQWLRDGLEVYNLFVHMKPLFFAMLAAQPDREFRMSGREANKIEKDARRLRLTIREEDIGTPSKGDFDRVLIAQLVPPGGPVKQGYGDDDWKPGDEPPVSR